MKKRPIEIKVRLNQSEFELLNKRVGQSGLSREEYLRQIIRGFLPRAAPPADYYAMMQQFYRIGNNLNQIAQKAHTLDFIDEPKFDAACREWKEAVLKITSAVLLPEQRKE